MDTQSLNQIISNVIFQYEQIMINELKFLIERGMIVPEGEFGIVQNLDGQYRIGNHISFKPSKFDYIKQLEDTLEKTLLENEQLEKAANKTWLQRLLGK